MRKVQPCNYLTLIVWRAMGHFVDVESYLLHCKYPEGITKGEKVNLQRNNYSTKQLSVFHKYLSANIRCRVQKLYELPTCILCMSRGHLQTIFPSTLRGVVLQILSIPQCRSHSVCSTWREGSSLETYDHFT